MFNEFQFNYRDVGPNSAINTKREIAHKIISDDINELLREFQFFLYGAGFKFEGTIQLVNNEQAKQNTPPPVDMSHSMDVNSYIHNITAASMGEAMAATERAKPKDNDVPKSDDCGCDDHGKEFK